MNNIARQEIYHGRYLSPKEIMKAIDSVTLDGIKDLSEKLVHRESCSLTVYGPIEEEALKGIID
jgi:predicted Zn-dependent peptidase